MINDQGLKLGYIWLKPGVSRLNGWTLLYVLFISIGMLVFLNFQQPYVLKNMLGIPQTETGRVIAQMALVHELVLIGMVSPFGALADRIGRRPIITLGYVLAAVGYIAYPFATTVFMLTAFRAIFAVGAAAIISTFTTVLTDYPKEQSRSKLIALGSVLNALGLAILAGVGGQTINWLAEAGFDPITAGRIAITGVGLVGFVSAVVVWNGLKGEELKLEHKKIPLNKLIREGFGAARNPRIALAYASAFIARGDNVVIGAYLSAWAIQSGIQDGLTDNFALAKAGILVAIVNVAPLPLAAVFGYFNDKNNRITGLIIATAIATVGYLWFGSLESPLVNMAIWVGILMGCGQVGAVIAGQTLIGQEADPRITGTTLGAFNFFGSVGTLVSSVLGGILFDVWTNGGPFLMMGIGSALLLIAAIYVRLLPKSYP
ncbi:MAG: MFS transporter [Pseudomonadota bacterium]|nr:MFS transporter [Pseudomonadota bacterium]